MSYDHWHKILVVFAHPDDAEIHCGGTLSKLKAQLNSKITYVVAMNDDKGTKVEALSPFALAENRENEQLAVAKKIGVDRVIFLRHPDGDLSNTIALRNDLALLIRYFTSNVIFIHDPWQDYQLHLDHRNLGTALTDAIIVAREIHTLPAHAAIGLDGHHVFQKQSTKLYREYYRLY